MDWISLILGILAAVGSLSAYYLYILGKIKSEAAGAIENAEQDGKTGKEKFCNAVDNVYALIPAPARVFIARSIVEAVIQATFDKIEEYAKKQSKK